MLAVRPVQESGAEVTFRVDPVYSAQNVGLDIGFWFWFVPTFAKAMYAVCTGGLPTGTLMTWPCV